ncbi:hypothetical protein CAPTEDRAFT_197325 [Capitella teleta]|uniref:G-protein coupled receptors family 1 profile domain-containing protein n=1 Tax=Capitella teleta TaxID=283909 RepID=R7TW16_CAPTE|nr:hypothetical protein CAPTEDRAFT_197325 [Capitella teleta]|eukprot:ELT95651.1 hypothetical protein CAPTEDRAFT_197325 [Capitella teleta]
MVASTVMEGVLEDHSYSFDAYTLREFQLAFSYLHISEYYRKYAAGLVIIIGILGNLLTIAVMMTKTFRKSPSSLVLIALAVADTGKLSTNPMQEWLRHININIFYLYLGSDSSVICKAYHFSRHLFRQLSAAFVVILTLERFVSVYYPMRCREICSKHRLEIFLILVVIVYGLINIWIVNEYAKAPLRWGPTCTFSNPFKLQMFQSVKIWVKLSLRFFAPITITFTSNILVAKNLIKAQKTRKGMSSRTNRDGKSLTPMLMAPSPAQEQIFPATPNVTLAIQRMRTIGMSQIRNETPRPQDPFSDAFER